MFLGKRIKELREEKGLLQRQLAAELEIDSPMYSKIERGERRAKREQVIKLAELLKTDKDELLTLWLAGQVLEIIEGEETGAHALEIVKTKLNQNNL
jgi:transcriptional regulator with XRE-family HTH domain